MSIVTLQSFFGWCTLLNAGLLIVWFAIYSLAHDRVYRLHSRLFRISVAQFDAIHYAGLTAFRLLILVFNLVPYLALCLM